MSRIAAMTVCLGMLAALAPGDIVNPFFTDTTARGGGDPTFSPDGWTVALSPSSDRSLAMQDVLSAYAGSSNVLNVQAANHYTWDTDSWSLDDDYTSKAEVWQACLAPSGMSALEFRMSATYAGADIYGTAPSAMPAAVVSATYMTLGGSVLTPRLVVNTQDWDTLGRIDLPDIDTSQFVTIKVMATSPLDEDEPHGSIDTKTVTVTGYFDDLQFVPEPATVLLLLAGACVLGRRRGR